MQKIIIGLIVIIFIFACSGGGSDSSEDFGSLSRPALSSATDLRLGQLSNSSSPVAFSAALQNGE